MTGAGQSDKPRRRRRRWLARLTVAAFTILLITEFVGPFATTWLIESRLRDCVDLGAVHIDTTGHTLAEVIALVVSLVEDAGART